MTSDGKNVQTLFDRARFYVGKGLSVIPLAPKGKEPNFILLEAVGSLDGEGKPTQKPYYSRQPTIKELETWFKHKSVAHTNIGVVAGVNGVAILDIDDDRYYHLFFEQKREELRTWVGRPSKGCHVYMRLPESAQMENVELPGAFELKVHDKYVVCPPSVHPSGIEYTWLFDIEKMEIATLSAGNLNNLTKNLKFLKQHWQIIKTFSDIWTVQHRHNLSLWLSGFLLKRGLNLKDAGRIVKAICTIANDSELKDRLTALTDTYKKTPNKTAGISKLREELISILGPEQAEGILGKVKETTTETIDQEIQLEAEKLLEDPALLHRIHNAQGVVQGEDENRVLLPILNFAKQSLEVQGETSAGKNTLVDSALSLFPRDWWKKITGLTDKSIRYLGGTLRTLYLAERKAMKTGEESTAEYDIKLVISEGKLKVLSTVSDPENPKKFKTEEIETEIENVILTSTELVVPQELQNRIWVLRVDDSKDQNKRVRDSKLQDAEKLPSEKPDFTRDREIIQAAFAIAEEEAPKDVVIPYATILASLLDEKEPRVRRDTDKLISLIKGIARLFYRQRLVILDKDGRKVVVSSPEDFWIACRIGSTAIKETFTDTTGRDVRILEWCKELADDEKQISTKTLHEITGKSDASCQKYLRALQLKGFLVEEERGAHGLKLYSLKISDRNQLGIDQIPICEMKIRHENWLKSQNLSSDWRKTPTHVLMDPITGIRVESISSLFHSEDLARTGKNTLDSSQKTDARSDSDLVVSGSSSQEEDWRTHHPGFFSSTLKEPLHVELSNAVYVCHACWVNPKYHYQEMSKAGTIHWEPIRKTGDYICQVCGKEPAGYKVII